MKQLSILLSTFFLLLLAIPSLQAQKGEAPIFSTKKGALKGYDPVAYFTAQQPIKGKSDITTTYKEATFHFSSEENKAAFLKNPAHYVPQYGGYCAWAVSQGYTAPIDPFSWAIVNDKLYLNYNKKVQKKWDKDREGFIQKADANFPGLVKQ
ncbi:MAG: YHS domain-containing (seleno)protein [Bacteroidota bacterium]